jgi:hypothetical protein
VAGLAQSGWNIKQVVQCCVQRVNNVENDPIHDVSAGNWVAGTRFRAMSEILQRRQDSGKLRFSMSYDPTERALIFEAGAAGEQASEDRQALADLLGTSAETRRFRVRDAGEPEGKDELVIQTRSLLGVMYALSQVVDVPAAHVDSGEVRASTQSDGGIVAEWIDVRHSRVPSSNAACQVFYRGYWFYVPRDDWSSKRTFALLTYLYSLQAGTTASQQAPVLTVGAG